MQSKTGKLIYRYVGSYGCHTEVIQNDKTVAAGYGANTSILYALWCIADRDPLYAVKDLLEFDFVYANSIFSQTIIKSIFRPKLYSKYDILFNPNALALAYLDMVKSGVTIDDVLSAKYDLEQYIKQQYNIQTLKVIYEQDEDKIWYG